MLCQVRNATTLSDRKTADIVITRDKCYKHIKGSDSFGILPRGAFLRRESTTVETQAVEAAKTKLPQSFMTWSEAS